MNFQSHVAYQIRNTNLKLFQNTALHPCPAFCSEAVQEAIQMSAPSLGFHPDHAFPFQASLAFGKRRLSIFSPPARCAVIAVQMLLVSRPCLL